MVCAPGARRPRVQPPALGGQPLHRPHLVPARGVPRDAQEARVATRVRAVVEPHRLTEERVHRVQGRGAACAQEGVSAGGGGGGGTRPIGRALSVRPRLSGNRDPYRGRGGGSEARKMFVYLKSTSNYGTL